MTPIDKWDCNLYSYIGIIILLLFNNNVAMTPIRTWDCNLKEKADTEIEKVTNVAMTPIRTWDCNKDFDITTLGLFFSNK